MHAAAAAPAAPTCTCPTATTHEHTDECNAAWDAWTAWLDTQPADEEPNREPSAEQERAWDERDDLLAYERHLEQGDPETWAETERERDAAAAGWPMLPF